MKNKRIVTHKLSNGQTACKYLLLAAFAIKREIPEQERWELRKKVRNRCIDDCTMSFFESNGLGGSLLVFDAYIIEELNFFQRIRHGFRMFYTAIFDYIGISSVAVEIRV